ncbi:MAG TPA: RNA polymerase subunit sigma-70 [Kofleriaceae bacterium]|jgi:RNA polymerase sigma-70 factor (ECF subfamily)|nr:RNA polymerase subunit sigma-70 [Kofleriaceae bacterium]
MTDRAFERLVGPYRDELRLHCYRMLGSSHDADDMVQETLLRAWRAKGSLDDPQAVRAWLYRIGTNVCIDELARRPKRAVPASAGPPGNPDAPPVPGSEQAWIEPCPSTWLTTTPGDPAASFALKESVALAFIAALQLLTPRQRAVLLLRDVVGLTAEQAAAALEMTVPATKSALHRARAAVEERPRAPDEPIDADLLSRYIRAWETADPDAMVALLHEEIVLAMPPSPTWFSGRAAVAGFVRAYIVPRARIQPVRLVRTGANGQMAFAFYREHADSFRLEAIQGVIARGGTIVAIDHFLMPEVFDIFGLSRILVLDGRTENPT